MAEKNVNYKDFKALAAYIDRVGAECKNFRRFLIVEHKARGYYIEKCIIKLTPDGEITCSDKFWEPTKAEREAIKAEIANQIESWPHSILATEAKLRDLRKIVGPDAWLFNFLTRKPNTSRKTGNIIMVQQRVQKEGAEKYFINWSFFSDGVWRAMEPDQALPLWKPEREWSPDDQGGRMVMIHEGPKTAKFWTDLKEDKTRTAELDAHPFGHIMKLYEHWGMIGGALAPHRTDYSDLVEEKPLEVIYVCDNDPPGKAALQKVSECYKRQLLGVMFDGRFPLAWDLCDPMPPALYNEKGKYIGPAWEELLTFATHATDLKPNPEGGKGRPITVLTEAFKAEWFHCVSPEVFVHHRWPSMILGPNEFNNHIAPFSHVDDTARLLKKDKASKSTQLSYRPGVPSGYYVDPSGSFINTHIPTTIKPKQGDAGPWIGFLTHLVPDQRDRYELSRWIATLVVRREIKMLYGVLLISEAQGIGKGTLGERVLAPLVGHSNTSYPSEGEIVDSNYNYWAAHKRLAVVHEIYAGQSAKAYNKLKSIVTDRFITVQKKYQANYEIENWIHMLACSNSMRAIQLSMDDRRWFVPKLTEEKKPTQYWEDFNNWLSDDGLSIILQWCIDFLKENPAVMKGESSPPSLAKKEMVEDGWSVGMEAVGNFLDFLRERLTSDSRECVTFRERMIKEGKFKDGSAILIDKDLPEYIKNKLYEGRQGDRLEKPGTLRKIAKAKGWHVGEDKVWHFKWGIDSKGGRVISLLPREAAMKTSDIELVPIRISDVDGM